MQKSFIDLLESYYTEYNKLKDLLLKLDISLDKDKFVLYSKELSKIKDIVGVYIDYKSNEKDIEDLKLLLKTADSDFELLILEEIKLLLDKRDEYEFKLNEFFSSKDSVAKEIIYIELRSASGGDESSIFVGDLFKMYSSFFYANCWKFDIVNSTPGIHGGYKDIILKLTGKNLYSKLKYESGIHRVQRIPKTETQGRIHTSTCTVAVLLESNDSLDIDINNNDLRIDTYRASGAGGQHVNKTDSAVRVTHLPTGIVVECQEERSQHKNKAKALVLLKAKLLFKEQNDRKSDVDVKRKEMIGTGSRSEKIRTYNYPQNRITDHRYNFILYRLSDVMDGRLDLILNCFFK